MSKNNITLRLKPYIQPFERELAFIEATRFLGGRLEADRQATATFTFTPDMRFNANFEQFINKSAYWLSVYSPFFEPTRQSVWEATTEVAKANGSISINNAFDLDRAVDLMPNRRCLRYGVHGMHEYRGKFFPQLARSLMNISLGAGVNDDVRVLDPMVGSGTTAVEAVSLGYNCFGMDMNPLSVLMAKTKTEVMGMSYQSFVKHYKAFNNRFCAAISRNKENLDFLSEYSDDDAGYLNNWFPRSVLEEIGCILAQIDLVKDVSFKAFVRLSLSNVLRSVSLQKIDDLRIRKAIKPVKRGDVFDAFTSVLEKNAASVSAFLYYKGDVNFGIAEIKEGDAKDFSTWGLMPETIDCVVTSPPYATALPYLDTDRLSLILFGLVEKNKLRELDYSMIGNREVTKKLRERIWKDYLEQKGQLPRSVNQLIGRIKAANERNDVGFRRRNMPFLLAKYFLDMRSVFESTRIALRNGADAFVVIGDNRTTSGETVFDIRSTQYLREIGEMVGFTWIKNISMDMLISRDIHRENALKSESIIWLRKANSTPTRA